MTKSVRKGFGKWSTVVKQIFTCAKLIEIWWLMPHIREIHRDISTIVAAQILKCLNGYLFNLVASLLVIMIIMQGFIQTSFLGKLMVKQESAFLQLETLRRGSIWPMIISMSLWLMFPLMDAFNMFLDVYFVCWCRAKETWSHRRLYLLQPSLTILAGLFSLVQIKIAIVVLPAAGKSWGLKLKNQRSLLALLHWSCFRVRWL